MSDLAAEAVRGLPRLALQRAMQLRTQRCCLLIEQAFAEANGDAQQRAGVLLHELATISAFTPLKRFGIFSKELGRVLNGVAILEPHAEGLLVAIARACALLEQCFIGPAQAAQENSLDIDALGSLRALGRTNTPSDSVSKPRVCHVAAPSFWHCLLKAVQNEARGADSEAGIKLERLVRFVNRATSKTHGENFVHKSRAETLLSVELLSREMLLPGRIVDAYPRQDSRQLQGIHYELARNAFLMCALRAVRMLIGMLSEQASGIADAFANTIRVLCVALRIVAPRDNIAELRACIDCTQLLIVHLRCWPDVSGPDQELLALCLVAIEMACLQGLLAAPQHTWGLLRASILRRRVCKYIAHKHGRLASAYMGAVRPSATFVASCASELQELHTSCAGLALAAGKSIGAATTSNRLLYTLTQCTALCLCTGDIALYEVLFRLKGLCTLMIESRLRGFPALLELLAQLTAYALHTDKKLALRELCQLRDRVDAEEERLLVDIYEPRGLSLPSAQLAIFLAENIHELIVLPEELEQPGYELAKFRQSSRRCITELNMLASGARALRVYRVAELSAGLEQLHSALGALPECIDGTVLHTILLPAHKRLRECLNQAAARQQVTDVQALLAELYRYLETSLPVVAIHWRKQSLQQRSSRLVAELAIGLRSLEDLLGVSPMALDKPRHKLFQDLLEEQQLRTEQLREEIEHAQKIAFARLRSRLQRCITRHANSLNVSVQLRLHNEALRVDREVLASLVVPLERVLRIVIAEAIAPELCSAARDKPSGAYLDLEVGAHHGGVCVLLSDSGAAIPDAALAAIRRQMRLLKGELTSSYVPLQGNRLRLCLAP